MVGPGGCHGLILWEALCDQVGHPWILAGNYRLGQIAIGSDLYLYF
jgi:hypothetical protein